jgi:hypothetical protein
MSVTDAVSHCEGARRQFAAPTHDRTGTGGLYAVSNDLPLTRGNAGRGNGFGGRDQRNFGPLPAIPLRIITSCA